MTVHVRSQDMFHGWPRNMFAARKMQKEIADAGGYPMGKLAMVTHSAHMYADDWATAQELLDKYYIKETAQYKPGFHFQEDQRGNWLVDIDWENKLILAKLMTADMATELTLFHGKTAKEVIKQIGEWEILTLPSHALDFGAELQKAEIALNYDLRDWKQDRAINFERQKVESPSIEKQERLEAPTRYIKRGKKSIPLK